MKKPNEHGKTEFDGKTVIVNGKKYLNNHYPYPYSFEAIYIGNVENYPFIAVARCWKCGMFESKEAEEAYYKNSTNEILSYNEIKKRLLK